MSKFEYHALKSMTEWLYLWALILAIGTFFHFPILLLAPAVGCILGSAVVCGRYRVVPGNPIRVVER